MLLWHLSALSLTEYSRVDKGAGADGGNGRSLCYDHTSGANHRGTTGNNGHWQELIPQILGFIYWTGVLLLTLRFLIQLGSIIRLHFLCPKSTIQGSRVHILKKGTGPFSFFHWIFIHPESHTESEISEIITHEETHARQYHSADVLVSEIMCTFCWFNPFVWLMKRETQR